MRRGSDNATLGKNGLVVALPAIGAGGTSGFWTSVMMSSSEELEGGSSDRSPFGTETGTGMGSDMGSVGSMGVTG